MTVSLIPVLTPSQAPWQLPMPGTLSPLSSYGVSNPSDLTLPVVGPGAYQSLQGNVYSFNAALAASLGYGSDFQIKTGDTAQYFLYEYIYYNTVAMTGQSSFDPNSVIANLYAGYGFRIVLAFVTASASASSTFSQFAAEVTVNGAALYSDFQDLGFNQGSTLAKDVANIATLFSSGSQFNVDTYAKFQVAMSQFVSDIASAKEATDISPVLIGVDVNQASISAMCSLNYPASAAYALNAIGQGANAAAAVQGIAKQTVQPWIPPITIDPSIVYAIYAEVLQSADTTLAPSSAQKTFAQKTVKLGS